MIRDDMKDTPQYSDVILAAKRIAGVAIRTPLLNFGLLDDLMGAKVWIKAETLQETGSFKFRGAFNAVKAIPADIRKRGIVAASSGNHAQAIAKAASIFGVSSHIVMPKDAPTIKIERTKNYGANVVLYDRYSEDRVKIATTISEKHDATFIHPYEHSNVIAGQGTCGLEICEQLQANDQTLDHMLVCTGGGGLTAGITLGINEHFPNADIHTCEPEYFDDYARSLKSGNIETNDPQNRSICDAIVTPSPGLKSFEICNSKLGEGLTSSDGEVFKAVAFAFKEFKLVVEPGGAIALSCLLHSKNRFAGKTVALTLSGGNVSPQVFNQALNLGD